MEEGKEERIWREQSPDLCQSILAENKHKSLKSHFMRVGVGDWMTEEIVSVSEKKKAAGRRRTEFEIKKWLL